MLGLTLRNVTVDALPLSATPVTLTNNPDRYDVAKLTVHAADPTCWDTTHPRDPETLRETGTLTEIAARHYGTRIETETVHVCRRCDQPGFRAYRAEVGRIVTATNAYRQLRFELFRASHRGDPTRENLATIALRLVETARDRLTTDSATLTAYLGGKLAAAHAEAAALRDQVREREPGQPGLVTGPWVAVGVNDLPAAWKTVHGPAHLAYGPGNVFDHPVAVEHFFGPEARAVIALPPSLAQGWRREYPAVVETTDVPLTVDDTPHLGFLTRLWAENPTMRLDDVVVLGLGITAPAAI